MNIDDWEPKPPELGDPVTFPTKRKLRVVMPNAEAHERERVIQLSIPLAIRVMKQVREQLLNASLIGPIPIEKDVLLLAIRALQGDVFAASVLYEKLRDGDDVQSSTSGGCGSL